MKSNLSSHSPFQVSVMSWLLILGCSWMSICTVLGRSYEALLWSCVLVDKAPLSSAVPGLHKRGLSHQRQRSQIPKNLPFSWPSRSQVQAFCFFIHLPGPFILTESSFAPSEMLGFQKQNFDQFPSAQRKKAQTQLFHFIPEIVFS